MGGALEHNCRSEPQRLEPGRRSADDLDVVPAIELHDVERQPGGPRRRHQDQPAPALEVLGGPGQHPDGRAVDELDLGEIELELSALGGLLRQYPVEIACLRQVELTEQAERAGADLLHHQGVHAAILSVGVVGAWSPEGANVKPRLRSCGPPSSNTGPGAPASEASRWGRGEGPPRGPRSSGTSRAT